MRDLTPVGVSGWQQICEKERSAASMTGDQHHMGVRWVEPSVSRATGEAVGPRVPVEHTKHHLADRDGPVILPPSLLICGVPQQCYSS